MPNKVRRSGASKRARKQTTSSWGWLVGYCLRLSVVAVTAGVITAGIVWFEPKQKLAQFSKKPISSVQLEGSFQYLGKESASKLVSGALQESFLNLDIESLKQQLEQDPWIDTVIISRVWPDKLVVKLVEQKPIAQWGEKGFLNMRGDIIEVGKTAKIQSLPLLTGGDNHAKEIMQQYLSMNKVLSPHQMGLKSVSLDESLAWSVTLSDDIPVKLGRENILQKLQHLVAAKKNVLRDDFVKIQAIDMRYPSGFAVAWKNDEQYVAAGSVGHSIRASVER